MVLFANFFCFQSAKVNKPLWHAHLEFKHDDSHLILGCHSVRACVSSFRVNAERKVRRETPLMRGETRNCVRQGSEATKISPAKATVMANIIMVTL